MKYCELTRELCEHAVVDKVKDRYCRYYEAHGKGRMVKLKELFGCPEGLKVRREDEGKDTSPQSPPCQGGDA